MESAANDRLDVYLDNHASLTRGHQDPRVSIPVNWPHPRYTKDDEIEIKIDGNFYVVFVDSAKHKVGDLNSAQGFDHIFWVFRCHTNNGTYRTLKTVFGENEAVDLAEK